MNDYSRQPHRAIGRVRDSHLEYPRLQPLEDQIDARLRAERRERIVSRINVFTEGVGKLTRSALYNLGLSEQEASSHRAHNIRTGRRTIFATLAATAALSATIALSDTEPVAYDTIDSLEQCVEGELSAREMERREGITDQMTTEEFSDLAAVTCYEKGKFPFDVDQAVQIVREGR